MAIINGTQIGTTNISGRDVGVLLKEKPFPYLYPDGVTRMSFDSALLCLSPNVNKWSTYKPVNGGSTAWGRTGFEKDNKIEQEIVKTYQPPTGGDNNPYCLAHFGGYRHDSNEPYVRCNETSIFIAPASTRTVMITYTASGLDFRNDGYNELIISQEMTGGGKSVVKRLSLNSLKLYGDNTIDVPISSDGMAIGNKYRRNIYIQFGTSGNPYITVGDKLEHFRLTLDIECTYNGNDPNPPKPNVGTMSIALINAPTSISAVNPILNNETKYENGSFKLLGLSVAFNEDNLPPNDDFRLFKEGYIDLYYRRSTSSDFTLIRKGLAQHPQISPAMGCMFSAINNNIPVLIDLPVPSPNETYYYEARWNRKY